MLSKCANPACRAAFQYLRQGRLYQFELEPLSAEASGHPEKSDKKPARNVEHFWLCSQCSETMTLACDPSRRAITVVPLPYVSSRRAAAS
jgi:hypothetical protein